MIFGRKSKEEQRKEKEDQARIRAALSSIRIFPGNLAEYQAKYCRPGEIVEIIDTGLQNKGIRIKKRGYDRAEYMVWDDVARKLVDEGIEAIIHASYSRSESTFGQINNVLYGMPIRRKKQE